jgi:hypothetical protein
LLANKAFRSDLWPAFLVTKGGLELHVSW